MVTGQEGAGGDARCWNEERYRKSILQERELRCRTVFRTAFAPSQNPNPEILVVASSDGSLSSYSLASCIASMSQYQQLDMETNQRTVSDPLSTDPLSIIQAHKGPAYDLKFYSHGENSLLFSCGDDGRLRGWNWKEILSSHIVADSQGNLLKPLLDLANPQHEGPWGALSPIPENNAITINEQALLFDLNDNRNKLMLDQRISLNDQFYSYTSNDEEGSVYSAAGDARAYSWDIETGKQKLVFKGHADYLHCITARKSSHQIITGSEDGTTRIWDCRSGLCTQVIHSGRNLKSKLSSWVSCVAIDSSESWLVCGTGTGLSVWSLLSYECIFSIDHYAPVQDLLFDDNQIVAVGSEPVLTRFSINGAALSQLKCAPQSAFSVSLHPSGVIAVGGYGALVDVLSQFGSHLCTFYCLGLDNYS